MAQKSKAYARWKDDYMAMVHDDPVAFRAALCMGKEPGAPMVPRRTPKKKTMPAGDIVGKYMVGLRHRLHDDRVFYVKECDIKPRTVKFFDKLIPTSYAGTTLSTCEVVGMAMLRKCVPPSEVKFYTFKKTLGQGLHGFVFQCLYKGREKRAVKLVVLHDGEDEYKIDAEDGHIWSVSKPSLAKEFKMHQDALRLMDKSGRFRVLNILSGLCVFKPPKFDKQIGVYIMETLQPKTLDSEIDAVLERQDPQAALPRLILEKVREVPRVIAELHRWGVAHSDMHTGNVAFDPDDPRRPYLLDFGRMQWLKNLGEQAQLYRVLDFAAPLHSYLRSRSIPPETVVELYNAYIQGVTLSESDEAFVNLMKVGKTKKLGSIFHERLDNVKDIQPRFNMLERLMDARLFKIGGKKMDYYTLTEEVL